MLFGLTRAFQNGMTGLSSTYDHGAAPPQGKGLSPGQVLLGRVGGYYPPKSYLTPT